MTHLQSYKNQIQPLDLSTGVIKGYLYVVGATTDPLCLLRWGCNMSHSLNWFGIWGFHMFLSCSRVSGMMRMNRSSVTVSPKVMNGSRIFSMLKNSLSLRRCLTVW